MFDKADTRAPTQRPARYTALRRVAIGFAVLLITLVLVVIFFPWDAMRGPINRYVSDQLGRRFEITQHLSVHLGRTVTVRADGLEFANPEWAKEPYLVKARAAEFDIRLWPLLLGRVELPRVLLIEPQIGLQIEPDGRRTWALSRDTSDTGSVPNIGALTVDSGTLKYRAQSQGAEMTAQFSLAAEGASAATPSIANFSSATLPLSYKVAGKWRNTPFTASGRAGGVLQLSKDFKESFPIEVNAAAGHTTLKAKGTVENLQEFTGLDAAVDIEGRNLEELYQLAGVVLPSTPPYKLKGRLDKQGEVWSARQIQGVLGTSDLSGDLSFDTTAAVPLLTGKVQSKILDFADLRPVVGLPVTAGKSSPKGPANATAVVADKPKPVAVTSRADPARKVLPTATLDLVRLKSMNADVVYSASSIRHVKELPLDKGSVHVKLTNGLLQLDPLMLGVAGGSLAGKFSVDVNVVPAAFDAHLALRALQLNQLFPTIETTRSAFGKVSGQINLTGHGNSAAQMLGSSSGDVAVLMGKGELSNILLEFMGLDGGEVIKFFVRGDRNVKLLCSAAAFEVRQGVMNSKVIVLDTTDTVINGSGQVNLATETLDITLHPQPKDHSILSLRSPLRIGGTFASPSAGPDKLALGARAGVTLGLAFINPLLALASTFETGPGQDADCRGALAIAADPKAKAQPAQTPGSPLAAAQAVQNQKPDRSVVPTAPAFQGAN
ncbi:MAG: AsmA family protein [Pseudomonadota bacterium]